MKSRPWRADESGVESLRRHGPAVRSAIARGVAVVATVLAGCGVSPWEQDPLDGRGGSALASDRAERSFTVGAASIGEWVDRRPSGSVIRHGMLILDDPALETGPRAGRTAVVVTVPGGALYDKMADVVSDRIPVMAGMRTNFAIGVVTPVRIERVSSSGARETIAEGRVSFLEIVRR
jgi:hypothetical protein